TSEGGPARRAEPCLPPRTFWPIERVGRYPRRDHPEVPARSSMAHHPLLRRCRFSVGLMTALACAVAGGAPVLAPSSAWAQPEAYKEHMENGVKLFNDKNYSAALMEFRAAYQAKPKANPLLNIALCYKAQFNYPKAIQTLEQALRDHASTMEPADKAAA